MLYHANYVTFHYRKNSNSNIKTCNVNLTLFTEVIQIVCGKFNYFHGNNSYEIEILINPWKDSFVSMQATIKKEIFLADILYFKKISRKFQK